MSEADTVRAGGASPAIGSTARERGRRRWLVTFALVPMVATTCTLKFMCPPPDGGPWTTWDVVSYSDFVTWNLIAGSAWVIVAIFANWMAPDDSAVRAVALPCLVPILVIVAVGGALTTAPCPNQIPKAEMLEPLPWNTVELDRQSEQDRGSAELVIMLRSNAESADQLRIRSLAHYRSRGWKGTSDDTPELTAGEWTLWVGNETPWGAPPPGKVRVALSNSNGCDFS